MSRKIITACVSGVLIFVAVFYNPNKDRLHSLEHRIEYHLTRLRIQIERNSIVRDYIKNELVKLTGGVEAIDVRQDVIFRTFESDELSGFGRQLLGSRPSDLSPYKDLWGNPYRFRLLGAPNNQDKVILCVWSFGVNQKDEYSEGDDIMVDI